MFQGGYWAKEKKILLTLRRLVAAYTQAYISLAKLDNKATIVAREPREYSLLLGSQVHHPPQKN